MLEKESFTILVRRPIGRFFCRRVRSNEETDQTCSKGASLKRGAGARLKIRTSEPVCILYVLKAV